MDVLRRLEPAIFTAWPSAATVDDEILEQRVRRLERRGVMKPTRTGSGPRDQYLFDETAIVAARLYFRLLAGGVRLSQARSLIECYQERVREVVERGANLIAWTDRRHGVMAVTSPEEFERVVPAGRVPHITAVPLRALAQGVRQALRAIRRKQPTILADGQPTTVHAALKPKRLQTRRGTRRKSRG